jgi:aspartyl-tRNA(Asn)/glutamyl-tRNA(Gln) amidotransferase subunit B
LGTRCEIKNLNSIKHIIAAIEHEAERQVDILESGGHIAQETRLYDVDLGVTRSMRSKEEAADYRYFPDPDLLPIILEQSYIDYIAANMPELPDAKYLRYKNEYALLDEDIKTLISDKFVAIYFENLVALGAQAKIAANWIISELFGYLNKANLDIQDCPIKEEQLFELINLIHTGLISGKIAKQVFEMMINTGKPASLIVKEGNLMQISDDASIAKIIDQIIQDNPDNLAAYKAGKDKLFSFFVGQVMKQTEGKANPVLVNKLLHEKL